jgi:hypothetical protein
MATEQYPPPTAPPPVADRRSPERRSYARRAEDRAQFARTSAAAAMAVCGGLALIFIFFWALGAVNIKNAVASTIGACVLALVWLAGFLYRQRTEAERIQRHDRERRGF